MKVFLNPINKFGVFIRDYLPFVHAFYEEGDIICCKKEWDYYLPGPATEISDEEAFKLYGKKITKIGKCPLKPVFNVPDPIDCDIIIAPRLSNERKDTFDWCVLIHELKKAGRHITVVGHPDQTQKVEADAYSWDTWCGDIRYMAGAKLAITLDSGVGHLASLLNTPQLVIYEKEDYENAYLELAPGLWSFMRFNDMAEWNARYAKPVYSIEDIMAFINQDIVYVTDAELESLKGKHVSVTNYKAGTVFHSPHATLIMKRDGNTYTKTPGLLKKIKGLSATVAEAVTSGEAIFVSKEIEEHRLSICKTCPYHDARAFCRSCGCVTAAKVKVAKSRCPEGKWRSV